MYFYKELKMDLEYSRAKHRPLTIPQKHFGNTLKKWQYNNSSCLYNL